MTRKTIHLLALGCALAWAVGARAETGEGAACLGDAAKLKLDACSAAGVKKVVSGVRSVPFHSAPTPRVPKQSDAKARAPGHMPTPERDPRKAALKERAIKLLLDETARLARLLEATPPKSPDRLQLLRRVAEDFVELETAAEAKRIRLEAAEGRKKPTTKVRAELSRLRGIEVSARKSAIRQYQRIVAGHPSYSKLDEVLYYLAYEHERAGDSANARKVYYELIQKAPKSAFVPNAYLAFGELFFQEAQGDPGKWPLAAQAYSEVAKYPPPANKVYGLARYKLGYVYWNQGDLPRALGELARVIEHGMRYPKLLGAEALASAARHDLVEVYASTGQPGKAYAFFQPLSGDAPGERTRTLGMLDRLGTAYLDTGHYTETVTLYRDLLERDRGAAECHYQTQITTAVEAQKSGDKARIVAELGRQLALRDAFVKRDVPARDKKQCSNDTAGLLSETAMAWHLEAVGSGGVRGTNDEKTLDHAASLYQEVLDHFGAAELGSFEFPRILREDWPSAGKLRYALADIHYGRGRWEECARAFDAVVALDPKGPDAAEASYAALICYQKLYEKTHAEREARQGRGLGPDAGAVAGPEWGKLAPKPLGELEQRMSSAFGRYLCFVEPAKDDRSAKDKHVEVEFARARLDYEAQHWEEAALGFRHVALEHSDHDAGIYAAQLYLECLNVLATRGSPPKEACLDDMSSDVPRFSKLYCGGRKDVPGEQCDLLERVGIDLERMGAQRLVARADAMPSGSPEALELYRKAGERYLALFRGHCEAPLARGDKPKACSRADEILYDMARAFQAGHLLAKAIQARLMLLDPRYGMQDGAVALKALFELGQNHQAIADYAKAADFYERYAEAACKPKHECGDQAARALSDAIVLRLGLGESERAIAQAKSYERRFGARHPSESADVAFALAQHFAERGDFGEAQRRLAGSMRMIDARAAIDVRVQAHALLGRTLIAEKRGSAARSEFERVIRLWSEPKQAVAELGEKEPDRALLARRIGRALEAVGAAELYFADEKRQKAEAVRFPAYHGPKTKAAVLAHIDGPVRAWIAKKRPLLEAATREYRKVADLVPSAPPSVTIVAGARVGRMWGDFVKEFRAAPIPDAIARDPELRNAYYEALDRASEPQKLLAKGAFETCLDYSAKYQHASEESRSCEEWLAANYKAEYHVIDEFRGAPTRKNDPRKERARAVSLSLRVSK